MEDKAVLETYLHQFRILTFAQNYQAFAQDACVGYLVRPF
jgi:hypothetical protein